MNTQRRVSQSHSVNQSQSRIPVERIFRRFYTYFDFSADYMINAGKKILPKKSTMNLYYNMISFRFGFVTSRPTNCRTRPTNCRTCPTNLTHKLPIAARELSGLRSTNCRWRLAKLPIETCTYHSLNK